MQHKFKIRLHIQIYKNQNLILTEINKSTIINNA